MLKKVLLKALEHLGWELRRKDDRRSLAGSLRQLRRAGFAPAAIVDVGAARGDFTRAALAAFPGIPVLMVEPLAEFADPLQALASQTPATRLFRCAAGARDGEVRFNVHADLVGSSLLGEAEGEAADGVPRVVPLRRLDGLAAEAGLPAGPLLLKVDVQGAELDVLAGAGALLERDCAVILEVSLLPFFKGGPLAADVVAAMAARGYALYDIFGLCQRPLDGAMAQCDMVFVRADGPLRRDHRYATPEQRAALTRRLVGAA